MRLFSWNNSSSWNNLSHNSTNGLDTECKWGNINKKDLSKFIGFFTTKNTTLYSSTIGNGFIRVDTSVWFFTIEEIFNELLDFWNSSRTTDKHDFVNFGFFHTCIIEDLLYWLESFFEKVTTKFFESGSSNCFREINTINQSFN